MEAYFTLKEKFANYLFFPLGRGRDMLNVQLIYQHTKRIIRGVIRRTHIMAIEKRHKDKNNDRYNKTIVIQTPQNNGGKRM
jgi:hypothetical protein